MSSAWPRRASGDASVTYCGQVARILQTRCLECHRSDAIGPFALETYEQAVNWAEDIRRFTAEGLMPPWKPVEGHGDFLNARRMPTEEIKLIDHWVAAGCPLGDRSDLPPKRKFSSGWGLGEPDLILRPEAIFDIAADGPDVYQCFVLPTSFPSDQYAVALEVRPTNYRVTHHVIVYTDTKKQARVLDERSPGPGYASSQGFPGFMPSGMLGGWAPGNSRKQLPHGMAKLLPRGADIVVQIHYHKTGKPERDRTEVGLYFAKKPVTRLVSAVPLMPPGGPFSDMQIPAGADNHPVRASFELPEDALAICVTPHMHLLGKDMRVTATLPDGSQQPIVWIRNWDFNWQETYMFRDPVSLPAGTRLDLLAHYDNTAENPNNPHDPPRLVRWGDQTEDEMCIAFIEVAPRVESHDSNELRKRNPARKVGAMLRSQIAEKLRARLSPVEFWRRLTERVKQRNNM